MGEADAEAEAGEVVLDEPAHVGALSVLVQQRHARAEQQFAAGEPRRRIDELRDVHPADRGSGPALAGRQLELERADEILDRQHRARSARWRR